jgi:hypothetical protein
MCAQCPRVHPRALSGWLCRGGLRFLQKLLFVHGAWSYRRLSKVILLSFYKTLTLYLVSFYFSFDNGFSGQVRRRRSVGAPVRPCLCVHMRVCWRAFTYARIASCICLFAHSD